MFFRVIKELTDQLESVAKSDSDELKSKVDQHYKQLSTQINRLKMLKVFRIFFKFLYYLYLHISIASQQYNSNVNYT